MTDIRVLPSQIPDELTQFLSHFPGNQLFVTIPGEESEVTAPHQLPGTLANNYKYLRERNSWGWHTFFTVNENNGSKNRTESDIVRCRSLFLDDDTPRDKFRTDFRLPPSLIVETSKGKFHYYWLTDTTDFETWKGVIWGMIQLYQTDPAPKDLSRILRLPTFKHKTGFVTRVVSHPGTVYLWADLVNAWPAVPFQTAQSTFGTDDAPEFDLFQKTDDFLTATHISPAINSMIMHWVWHGYSATNILKNVENLYNKLDPVIYQENASRYDNARKRAPDWMASARKTRQSTKKLHNIGELRIPQPLIWDWSALKSNPISRESVPSVVWDAAQEVGEWSAVGADPAILSAIFMSSALLSKNVLIHELEDDLTTHSQCGIIIVMDTGARKSSIYEQMNKPFFDFEQQLIDEWEEKRHLNQGMASMLEKQLKSLEKQTPKLDDPDKEKLDHALKIGSLLQQLEKLQVKRPWLRSSDVTPEKLVRKIDENQGTIAIISDDARQVVENLKGRYSSNDSTGEAVYINALTGSDILYERVSSDDIFIKKPVLNALLFVQPDAALKLKDSDMYIPSGLAARLPMYFYPVSGVDIIENTKRRPLDKYKMAEYYAALQKLCVRRFDFPLHVRISETGIEAAKHMDKKLVKLLRNSWQGHYDKMNKMVTLIHIYATCFAALDDPQFVIAYSSKHTSDYVLPTVYLNMAYEFAKCLFSQSIVSFDSIRYEQMPRQAKTVLNTIQTYYAKGKITEGFPNTSDIRNWWSGKTREVANECVDFLLEKDWLYATIHDGEAQRLNGGFPNKLVFPGDYVYHLNEKGIAKL